MKIISKSISLIIIAIMLCLPSNSPIKQQNQSKLFKAEDKRLSLMQSSQYKNVINDYSFFVLSDLPGKPIVADCLNQYLIDNILEFKLITEPKTYNKNLYLPEIRGKILQYGIQFSNLGNTTDTITLITYQSRIITLNIKAQLYSSFSDPSLHTILMISNARDLEARESNFLNNTVTFTFEKNTLYFITFY